MIGIEHSRDGRIVTITLNRPEKRNALNRALVKELTHVIMDLDEESRIRVLVLTGAGTVFSAGADLAALDEMRSAGFEENLADSRALAELFLTMRTCGKVLIARVNGHAIAGGSGLVAACDMAVAVDEAKFGFTEVRIGFVPALVSVLVRGKLLEQDTRELFLTGGLVDSERARKIGLIGDVVPETDLDDHVLELARDIARNTSPVAVRATKKMLADEVQPSLEKALDQAARLNAKARESPDCKAGIDAFLSRRDAPWVREFDSDHDEPA